MRIRRHNIIGISLIILLILILVTGFYSYIPTYSGFQTQVKLQILPNPSESSLTNPPSILLVNLYVKLINAIKSGNKTQFSQILDQLNYVNYPSDYKAIFKRFNLILEQLNNEFLYVNNSLMQANSLIKISNLTSAIQVLSNVNATLNNINSTLNELFLAYSEISNYLGNSAPLLYDQLVALKDIYLTYLKELLNLTDLINKITTGILNGKLIVTNLSIKSNTTSVLVGSYILIYGALINSAGKGIANQSVTIYINNNSYQSFLTSENGSFYAKIRISNIYEKNITLFASYFPQGNYINLYSPSSSNKVIINLVYYKPFLIVNFPKVAYPGKEFQVNGSLILENLPLANYTVYLQILNNIFANKTDSNGNFYFKIHIPENQTNGNKTILVYTQPNGPIAPAKFSSVINIKRSIVSLNISYASLTVAGAYVEITGKVLANNTFVANALVEVYGYGVNSYTYTDENGNFNIYIAPSLLTPIGNLDLVLYIVPNEAWISPLKLNLSIYVINPLEIAPILLLLFLPFAFRVRMHAKAETVIKKEEKLELPEAIDESDIYFQATLFVSRVTGKVPKESQTIREYLKEVKDILKGYDYYERISFNQEKKVYGFGLSEYEIKESIELFNKLKSLYEE